MHDLVAIFLYGALVWAIAFFLRLVCQVAG